MRIPARFAPIVFGAMLSAIMVAIVSAFVLATARGLDPGFTAQWLKSCTTADEAAAPPYRQKKGEDSPVPALARQRRPWRRVSLSAQLFDQPHFESPQFRQVMQPSIMTTAAVLHFRHSCAPTG